jgi:hypothetical protein
MAAKELISSVTVGSTASTIVFTSIPQTYTDLQVVISARANAAATTTVLRFLINNDDGSGSLYTAKALTGTGSAANSLGSSGAQGFAEVYAMSGNNTAANTFANISIYIPNYTNATNKSFSVDGVSEDNASASYQTIFGGARSSTEAVSKLTFYFAGFNTALQYSSASLYGWNKGSGGATVA